MFNINYNPQFLTATAKTGSIAIMDYFQNWYNLQIILPVIN